MSNSAPSPKAILRGHKAQVHACTFIRNNERLATGDADGFVVLWDLTIMRPRAVWKAHDGAILGIEGWGDTVVTHGRDHKLVVWKVSAEDEARLSTAFPLEDVPSRPHPWMLHLLEVNTMNFCPFAFCSAKNGEASGPNNHPEEKLIAVPNTLASEAIDIYALPSQTRIYTLRPGQANGMAMSLALLYDDDELTLIAAFENGFASVHRLQSDGSWLMTYRSQAHTQPVLSMQVHPSQEYFVTSSADSIIAKHPIPRSQQAVIKPVDSTSRVVDVTDEPRESPTPSLLAAGLQNTSKTGAQPPNTEMKPWEHPIKSTNTKHAGQQSLKIRSDGRIFATAGWDSNIRVFSCKTLKELAVLQWHKVGCYAVAFAEVPSAAAGDSTSSESSIHDQELVAQTSSQLSVKERRILQAQAAHWVAAGAKDGKVSLWDIY